jgi:hypothetical protein
MSGLRSDMSELGRIYPVWGPDMSGHQKLCDFVQRKSRLGVKMIRLGRDNLNVSK